MFHNDRTACRADDHRTAMMLGLKESDWACVYAYELAYPDGSYIFSSIRDGLRDLPPHPTLGELDFSQVYATWYPHKAIEEGDTDGIRLVADVVDLSEAVRLALIDRQHRAIRTTERGINGEAMYMDPLGRTIFIRLPLEAQRPIAHSCECEYCITHKEKIPMWDTLAIPTEPSNNPHCWTVHMPDMSGCVYYTKDAMREAKKARAGK